MSDSSTQSRQQDVFGHVLSGRAHRVQEVDLTPFQRPRRAVRCVPGTRLHSFDTADVLDMVDGSEATAAGKRRLSEGTEADDEAERVHRAYPGEGGLLGPDLPSVVKER